jgi:hypothetical protein
MSEWMVRLKPFGVAAWNLFLALLLAYAFLIVLMTASSQQGVAERLGRLSPAQDYSAAYPLWLKGFDIDRQMGRVQGGIEALDARIETAAQKRQEASDAHWGTLARLHALHDELAGVPACAFDLTLTVPVEVRKTLSRIDNCLPDANLSPATKKAASNMLANAPNIIKNADIWFRAATAVSILEGQRETQKASLAELKAQKKELKQISDSFAEISVLQNNWLPGGALLTAFPPSMIQILLAFVAGMFGALLITLVLIVYPPTDMKLNETGKGYGPRILLGGLISLCVYVVIGGGTAVLGTGNALGEGQANYLALCAIGILAGMFSDRVAAWLSERADAFFKLSAQQVAARAEEEAIRAAAEAQAAAANGSPSAGGGPTA